MDTTSAKGRIRADVYDYCTQLGLNRNQTRAVISAAMNKWGEIWSRNRGNRARPTVDDATQRAISEGRHVAGQFAEGNGHG